MNSITILAYIKKFWWVLAIIVVVIAVIFFASCKPGDIPFTMDEYAREFKDQANDWGIPDTDTNFQYKYTTPRGQIIESTVPVPSEFLGYADEGAARQTERFAAMFPLWTNGTALAGRRIYLVNPTRIFDADGHASPPCVTEVNDPGAPCIYVSGQRAAAATFGTDDRWQKMDKNPPIVLPHQQAQNWTYVEWFKASVDAEDEHRQGFLCRDLEPKNVFYYYQGANDTHPWQWGEGLIERKAPAPSDFKVIEPVK